MTTSTGRSRRSATRSWGTAASGRRRSSSRRAGRGVDARTPRTALRLDSAWAERYFERTRVSGLRYRSQGLGQQVLDSPAGQTTGINEGPTATNGRPFCVHRRSHSTIAGRRPQGRPASRRLDNSSPADEPANFPVTARILSLHTKGKIVFKFIMRCHSRCGYRPYRQEEAGFAPQSIDIWNPGDGPP